jgi:hypothetical protein
LNSKIPLAKWADFVLSSQLQLSLDRAQKKVDFKLIVTKEKLKALSPHRFSQEKPAT